LDGFDLAHPSQITGRKIGSAGAKAGGYAGTTETPKRNVHPTVKPTDLMAYLCRLVTPKGGIVLDPFCGSGSTGKAAVREGFNFIGIELDPEYANIARARIEHETTKAELCA
jgi:DNA modification methylase